MSPMDVFGRHEVLHMAAYFEHAISEELCEHPQIKNNPGWFALADKACEALAELYQEIGKWHMDEWETSVPAPNDKVRELEGKYQQNQPPKK